MNIGDKAFYWDHESNKISIPCPDCAGKCFHMVTLGCGDIHTIECENCKRGYENATGTVCPYQFEQMPKVEEVTIIGIVIERGVTKYQTRNKEGKERYFSEDVCETEEEAKNKASDRCYRYNQEELARYQKRVKEGRTWSWHATYHRNCIKKAQRDIDYHSNALDWANARKRES